MEEIELLKAQFESVIRKLLYKIAEKSEGACRPSERLRRREERLRGGRRAR